MEQYFVAFDGGFASWFFGQILIDKYMRDVDGSELVSSWGPDFMWCGAAASYIKSVLKSQDMLYRNTDKGSSVKSCVLIPVTSMHEDSRQIRRNKTRTHAQQLAIDMKPVHLYKHDFQKWLMYSKGFRDLVGGVGL